MQPQLLHFPPS